MACFKVVRQVCFLQLVIAFLERSMVSRTHCIAVVGVVLFVVHLFESAPV